MQTGTITKFSVTFAKNFCKKNKKTHALAILIQRKSRIIELFVKQLFLSLQTNCQKVKILLLMSVIKPFLMKKIFHTFFSNVVSNLDIPNPSNYFKKEKFQSLSAII